MVIRDNVATIEYNIKLHYYYTSLMSSHIYYYFIYFFLQTFNNNKKCAAKRLFPTYKYQPYPKQTTSSCTKANLNELN